MSVRYLGELSPDKNTTFVDNPTWGLSHVEKRTLAQTLLAQPGAAEKSDRHLSRQSGLSQPFVGKQRRTAGVPRRYQRPVAAKNRERTGVVDAQEAPVEDGGYLTKANTSPNAPPPTGALDIEVDSVKNALETRESSPVSWVPRSRWDDGEPEEYGRCARDGDPF